MHAALLRCEILRQAHLPRVTRRYASRVIVCARVFGCIPHNTQWEQAMNVTKSITVARPRNEVYAFWRDFENLPRFMQNVESVENLGGGRSHWCASPRLQASR